MTITARPVHWVAAIAMTKETEPLDIIKGSGNAYADFGVEDADLRQLKAKLAAEIIKTLDGGKLTVRKAARLTGFAAADFSRVRQADLGRFTVDRLMTMVNRLGSRVEVAVRVRPNTAAPATPQPHLL